MSLFGRSTTTPQTKPGNLPPPHNQGKPVVMQQVQHQQQHVAFPTIKIFLPEEEVRKICLLNSISFVQLAGQILSFFPTILGIDEESLKVLRKKHLLLYYQDEDEDWVRFDREQEWKDAIASAQKKNTVLKVRVKLNEAQIEKDKLDPPAEDEERQTPVPSLVENLPQTMPFGQPIVYQQPQPQTQPLFQAIPFSSKPVQSVQPQQPHRQTQQVLWTPPQQQQQVQVNPNRTSPLMSQQPQHIQYVQPQSNHQGAPQLLYPQYVQPQPQTTQTQNNTAVLAKLHEMGFNDDAKSLELLRQFNGNAESVINWYLTNEK